MDIRNVELLYPPKGTGPFGVISTQPKPTRRVCVTGVVVAGGSVVLEQAADRDRVMKAHNTRRMILLMVNQFISMVMNRGDLRNIPRIITLFHNKYTNAMLFLEISGCSAIRMLMLQSAKRCDMIKLVNDNMIMKDVDNALMIHSYRIGLW